VADNRVIDAAQSSLLPVSPKKSVVFLAALLVGLGLGFVYVMLKELFNNKILFRADIENYTTIPVVAELAKVRSKHPLVVNNPDHLGVAEQFRQVRANMGLYDRTITKKKLLVTSGISGEGKSFISANLALSLALSGKKVVLIDLDIRNPKTSHTFNVKKEEGIAEFLMGNISIKDIILPSEIDKNLFVISAGRSEENPTELLLNGKLTELFEYLEPRYDYIVVDSSPVGPITDAFILSEYCDTTLYVVRHGRTPKNVLQMLDAHNKLRGLKNITIIFNGVKSRGFGKGEFGYGYGYGYGYDYVYKEQKHLFQRSS
jgi:capsular exopolysaccharide synthesis family protein